MAMASSQRMIIMLLLVVLVVFSSSSAAMAAPTKADLKKLGCTEPCGNVSIPYPFGLKKKCYLEERFQITCNNHSQPYLGAVMVSNMSLEGGVRVMNFIASYCYDQSGKLLKKENENQNNTYADLWSRNFTISSTKNKFVAIGCDTYASISISDDDGKGDAVLTGCGSQCRSTNRVSNGTCSGIGCCQTSIPKAIQKMGIYMDRFNNHEKISDFNPCSYAFVVEDGAFNFTTSYLRDFKEEKMRMVLDWTIENKTCEEARNQTSYACGDKSDCHYDHKNGHGGYICKCLMGYEGNPYLSDGCQEQNATTQPSQWWWNNGFGLVAIGLALAIFVVLEFPACCGLVRRNKK